MLKETLAALDLTVDLNGQKYRPKLKPGDMVRYEQHFGRSLMDGVETDGDGTPTGIKFGVTELFFLAYTAMHRTGDYPGDFDAFVDEVNDLDVGDPEGKGEASAGTPSPA